MTTSSFIVSAPRHRSARAGFGTGEKAENVLHAIRAHYAGNLKAVPVTGGERAARRKLDPDDILHLTAHDLAAILRGVTTEAAVDILRALAADGAKEADIRVMVAAFRASAPLRLADAQRDLALCEAKLLTVSTDILERQRSRDAYRRHLAELEISLEQSALAVLRAADRDDA